MVSDPGGGDYELPPAGKHGGLCTTVVDLGQQQTRYGVRHQCFLGFALPECRITWNGRDGPQEGAARVGALLTASLHKRARLRALLEGWRGQPFSEQQARGFDLLTILGAAALVELEHIIRDDGRTFPAIKSLSRLSRGALPPYPDHKLLRYAPGHEADYTRLPVWIRAKILSAVKDEAQASRRAANGEQDFYDDIPF